MKLQKDILIDDNAISVASEKMNSLKIRTEELKTKLIAMYNDLTTALETPAGRQLELTAQDVLIQPIDDLLLVVQHVADTLSEINGTEYYKDIFVKYEELNESIKI